jgi:hypothetical protein
MVAAGSSALPKLTMMKRVLFTLLVGASFFVACTPSSGSPMTGSGDATAMTEIDPNSLDTEDPLVQDALSFAEHQGITLEEALRRLEHQQTIGDIQPLLEADLPDTYGGMWIEHQPNYRIIIAIGEGDEATIQAYIEGKPWAEFVEVLQVKYSLKELMDAQAAANASAKEINIAVSTATDVKQNRVEIYVGNPDLFRADLAAAGIELLEPVEILAIDANS